MGKLINMIEVGKEIQTKHGVWVVEFLEENGNCAVLIGENRVHMTQEEVLRKIFERETSSPHETLFNPHQVGISFYYPMEDDYSIVLLPNIAVAKQVYQSLMVIDKDSREDLNEYKEHLLSQYPHEEYDGISEDEIWHEDGLIDTGFAEYEWETGESWRVKVVNPNDPIHIE